MDLSNWLSRKGSTYTHSHSFLGCRRRKSRCCTCCKARNPSQRGRGGDGFELRWKGPGERRQAPVTPPPPRPVLTWSPRFGRSWRGGSPGLVWGRGAYGLRYNLHRRPGRWDTLWNWRREQQWWYKWTQAESTETARAPDQQAAGPAGRSLYWPGQVLQATS